MSSTSRTFLLFFVKMRGIGVTDGQSIGVNSIDGAATDSFQGTLDEPVKETIVSIFY